MTLCACGPRLQTVPPDGTSSSEHEGPDWAEQLLPVEDYLGDFQWRQRVTAQWPEGSRSFSAVLTKADGVLRLMGLDPMGRVGFVLELRDGQAVRLEKHPSVQFPFDPRFILLDVQRVFYPWGSTPGSAEARTILRGELSIVERFEEGRLQKRRFYPEEGRKQAEATVIYQYDSEVEGAPSKAIYHNLRHGYQLTIVTLQTHAL